MIDESDGDPTQRDVVGALQLQHGSIQRCYENGLRTHPRLAGRLVVTFTVDTRGRATGVTAAGLSEAPAVGACVRAIVERTTFRRMEGGSAEFRVPFTMTPGN